LEFSIADHRKLKARALHDGFEQLETQARPRRPKLLEESRVAFRTFQRLLADTGTGGGEPEA